MKKCVWLLVAGMAVTLLAGLICKNSFKNLGIADIEKMEDIRALECNVNQIFTEKDVELFIEGCPVGYFEEAFEEKTVLIVKPTDKIHQYNFTMTQEMEIIEVLNGVAKEGDSVEFVSIGGVYDQRYAFHRYDNDRPLHYGMMNLLCPDSYYLVFAEALETNAYTDVQRYRGAFTLFNTFNLSSDYSKPINAPIETIAYNDYENSEFLCDTQETVDKLVVFKTEVLQAVLTEEQWQRYRGTGN